MKNNNILILTYWSFKDALIQTYTLPYVQIIRKKTTPNRKIFLLTLEQAYFKMSEEEWNTEKEKYKRENIILIRFKYDHFGLKMITRILSLIIYLIKLLKKEKISTVHSWCMPAGALGYILTLFSNNKHLIIDSYEPHAESMVENGTWSKSSFKFKLLFWFEKQLSKKATTVIALTEGMRLYAKSKYNATFKNYYIKPALVNLNKFHWSLEKYQSLRIEKNISDKIICVYAGKLGGIYLEEEVFDFFKIAHNHWGKKFKVFLLTNKDIEEVNHLVKKKNIPKNCIETLFVNHNEIENYFQIADFAINPVKPVPSKQYCTSIKDGEYWAMGLPVVITKNISDDSNIIEKEDIGYVLKELTDKEYINACKKIDSILVKNIEEVHHKITSIAYKYRSFKIAENIYEEVYS